MLPRILIPKSTTGTAKPQDHIRLGPSRTADAGDTFSGILLETVMPKRKPVDWLISVSLHVAVLAAILAIPIFFRQSIDPTRFVTTYLASPPLIAPPPPASSSTGREEPRRATLKPVDKSIEAKLTMPLAIPKTIQVPHSDAGPAPEADLASNLAPTLAGRVLGGVAGGAPGGILGGTGIAPPPPPPLSPSHAAASDALLRVGGAVKAPLAISTPPPTYPRLALEAQVQGSVKINAIIDKSGNVVQARAMDGPPLLIAAALNAVKHWKYEPTYLNGVAWPVELTIDVAFHLS